METNYIDLRFENNDKVLEVGKGKPYRLLSIEGISSPEYVLNATQNTLADGSRIKSKSAAFRAIIIEAEYIGEDKKQERNRVTSFFNIHQNANLLINNNGTKRLTNYNVEDFKANFENSYDPLRFLVQLYCLEPYLLSEIETSEEIITWLGGMKFPVKFPTKFATAGERIVNIYNDGDVETPLTIKMYGPATNPKLTLVNTGEFIRLNKTLSTGDEVIITTEFGNKRVELNGNNAFNIMDLPASKFFNLRLGDNVLEYTTDDSSNNSNIKISYRNRYIGV